MGGLLDGGGNAKFDIPPIEQLRKLNVGFTGGGLTATYRDLPNPAPPGQREFTITSSPERRGVVENLAKGYETEAGALRGLLPSIRPGYSDLRAAQLARISDARNRTIGNLSETLSRRRVRGSSFGEDTIARTEAEFGRAASDVEAQTFLQELQLTTQFIQEIGNLDRGAFATRLAELNVQSDVAMKMALASQQVSAQAAGISTQVQIAQAQQSSGLGEIAGSIIGAGATLGSAYLLGPSSSGTTTGNSAGSSTSLFT